MASEWTEREVLELRISYGVAAGWSLRLDELAAKLGKTIDAIERKATDLGLQEPSVNVTPNQSLQPTKSVAAEKPASLPSTSVNHVHGVAKKGKRADLENRFFRSRSEANYARYLNMLAKRGEISSWEYEPHTFWFEKIKRGTRSYTPDFKVTLPNDSYEWHEVKGWMNPQSKTRLKRMKKYFPDEKITVIDSKWFSDAVRNGIAAILPEWEFGEKPR